MHQISNFPTVSDPDAMQSYPAARNRERDTLLDYVKIGAGQNVLDIQAAGGYLSDEVFRRLDGNVQCVCIEPCADLRARLDSRFEEIDNPLEHFYSIADESIDIALGLAGLHHSTSHRDTIGECYRVLRPGGALALCDVEEDGDVARWLNEYVNRNNSTGHDGRFIEYGSVSKLMSEVGLTNIREERRDVPWEFPDRKAISVFFKGLFGLSPTCEEIGSALDDYFTIREQDSSVFVDWQLIYCLGEKPTW